jgi:hypothetical protein
MPLKRGKGKKTFRSNVREFTKGPTFAKTSRKYGKRRALKQAVAVAYAAQRRKKKRRSKRR